MKLIVSFYLKKLPQGFLFLKIPTSLSNILLKFKKKIFYSYFWNISLKVNKNLWKTTVIQISWYTGLAVVPLRMWSWVWWPCRSSRYPPGPGRPCGDTLGGLLTGPCTPSHFFLCRPEWYFNTFSILCTSILNTTQWIVQCIPTKLFIFIFLK